jgi:hypothetical protein
MARPPNWLYRRFDRSPLSVPLDTAVNAPFRGAKVCFTRGGRTDRWPQTTAIPTRTILLCVNILISKHLDVFWIELRTSRLRGSHSRRNPPPLHHDRERPSRQWRTGCAPKYNRAARAEDRATRGRDPSADRGPRPGGGGTMPPPSHPGIGLDAINPSIVFGSLADGTDTVPGLLHSRHAHLRATPHATTPRSDLLRLRRLLGRGPRPRRAVTPPGDPTE